MDSQWLHTAEGATPIPSHILQYLMEGEVLKKNKQQKQNTNLLSVP